MLCPRYVADIAPARHRGALSCTLQLSINVGIVSAFALGLPYDDGTFVVRVLGRDVLWWQMTFLIGTLPPLLQVRWPPRMPAPLPSPLLSGRGGASERPAGQAALQPLHLPAVKLCFDGDPKDALASAPLTQRRPCRCCSYHPRWRALSGSRTARRALRSRRAQQTPRGRTRCRAGEASAYPTRRCLQAGTASACQRRAACEAARMPSRCSLSSTLTSSLTCDPLAPLRLSTFLKHMDLVGHVPPFSPWHRGALPYCSIHLPHLRASSVPSPCTTPVVVGPNG